MGGISQLSHLYIGETLPTRVRQMVGSAISLYMGALSAGFIHLFPVLTSALGNAGLFTALAGVNLLQMIFAQCFLPETKGLSLEQVQVRHFSSKKKQEEAKKAAEWRKEQEQSGVEGGGDQSGTVTGGSMSNDSSRTAKNGHFRRNTELGGMERREGMLNAAFDDSELGIRRRNISERISECLDDQAGDGNGMQRREAPATAMSALQAEGGVSTDRAASDGGRDGDHRGASAGGDVVLVVPPYPGGEIGVGSSHTNVM